jgi:hypothetical protein
MCHRPQLRRLYRSTLNPLKALSYSTPGLATTSRSGSLGPQAREWCRLHHGRFALNWSRGQSHSALKFLGVLMASMDRKSNVRRDDPSSCLMSDGWSMSALAHFADSRRTSPEVREVPIPDLSNRSKTRAYSITSSARASSVSGTVRPSALAVLRLITRSYLVGFCTGRSAGFSPLRMRST